MQTELTPLSTSVEDLVKVMRTMPAVATKRFLAGPVSGANAIPTFRAIVATDFPLLGVSTTIPLAKLTPTGVNGSITVTNGLITSATAPT